MALTRDELLEVVRSVLPETYTDPLEEENDGRGWDVFAAGCAVLARCAAAGERTTQAMYLLPHSSQTAPEAAGEAAATGNVILTRSAPTDGPINLEEGDQLAVELATLDGVTIYELGIELAVDVTLPAGSVAPVTVAVRAARPGYQGNVEDTQGRSVVFLRRTTQYVEAATSTAANTLTSSGTGDQFHEGMIGAFARFTAGVNLLTYPRRITGFTAPTTVTVDGPALVAGADNYVSVIDANEMNVAAELDGDLTGGVHGWLDALGDERGLGRNANEVDPEYRDRVKELPDLVAPNSLLRAARRILQPLGIRFRVMESRDREQFQGGAIGLMACDNPNVTIFPEDGEQHFCQGDRFDRQGFYVVVEKQAYGDPGWPAGIKFPGGVHPSNAVDWMACDGAPFGWWADLARLVNEIEKTRAAGIPWLLVLVDSIP